jgi:hypothetical protein
MMKYLLSLWLLATSVSVVAQEHRVEIWNSDKTASASCIENKFPTCQIQVNGRIIDVTPVTYSNIGKLGSWKIIDYDKVVTEPIEWLESTSTIQLVNFRTQAWRDGQRYTVTEAVLIKNGKYTTR